MAKVIIAWKARLTRRAEEKPKSAFCLQRQRSLILNQCPVSQALLVSSHFKVRGRKHVANFSHIPRFFKYLNIICSNEMNRNWSDFATRQAFSSSHKETIRDEMRLIFTLHQITKQTKTALHNYAANSWFYWFNSLIIPSLLRPNVIQKSILWTAY